MTRLFLEDNELDLTEGFSNFITYAVDDLQNLDSKATSFSKTIVLPGTARNNVLFGNIFDFNQANFADNALPNVAYNFNASRQARCRIEVNGLQIVKGVLRLLEIIIDGKQMEYECAVFGELGGFVSSLGNFRLEDLDFSAYDHTYALSGITGSWNSWNAGQGYYYPLIDYGGVSVNKSDYSYRTFRPALFMREYIDKIVTGAGYTWESTFFNTDFFKRLIVPNNQKELFIPKNQIFFTNASPALTASETITLPTQTQTDTWYITLPGFVGGLFTTPDNETFTYTGTSGTYTFGMIFSGALDFDGATNASTVSIRVEVEVNGSVAYWNNTTYGRSGDGIVTINYNESAQVPLATNDVVKFRIQVTTNRVQIGLGFPMQYDLNITGGSVTIDSQVPVLSPAELGDTIRFREIMPRNIFQRDFFTSVLKMFNLLVTEDRYRERHLIIEPYINFYTGSVVDWSDKLDRSSPIRLKPMSEINARYYQFIWKSDGDYYNDDYRKKYNQGYGDRVYDNALDFARDTQKVEVIFAATPLLGYQGEDKITPAIFKRNNALEERIEHVIRVMQAKKITGVTSWDILNNTTVLGSYTEYPYAGHFDDPDAPAADINFGVPVQLYFELAAGDLSANLFNAYYSSYFAEITDKDSRVLTGKFKLNDTDIFNLDFAKFVYVDGGYYRISKVIDYNAGSDELTQCELLRVINLSY